VRFAELRKLGDDKTSLPEAGIVAEFGLNLQS
jgi:hypothetical protein